VRIVGGASPQRDCDAGTDGHVHLSRLLRSEQWK